MTAPAGRIGIVYLPCVNGLLISSVGLAAVRSEVARLHAGMLAHAWVEVTGVPMGEAEDMAEKFSPLERIPSYPVYEFTP